MGRKMNVFVGTLAGVLLSEDDLCILLANTSC